MKKNFVLSLFVALGLIACGDESSGTAPSADSNESSSGQTAVSSSSAQKNNMSSSSVKETSGKTPATAESSENKSEVSVSFGTLTDVRDGKTYKTVEIGMQTWMAENLNFKSNSSYCYRNYQDSCDKYGRLYTYEDAVTACPEGYRLPSRADFDGLLRPLSKTVYDERLDWQYNLYELSIKATTDWIQDTTTYVDENGKLTHLADATNSSGFTLLPAGYMNSEGHFYGAGKETYLWSSADGPETGTKYAMELDYRYDGAAFFWWDLDYALSVRCVKN